MIACAPVTRGSEHVTLFFQQVPQLGLGSGHRAQQRHRRHLGQQQQQRGCWIQASVSAVAIPGPLHIDGYGRDNSRPRKLPQLSPGNFIEFPVREDSRDELKRTPPLVRVRLAVEYRVHSRQMLCVGGSQIPFGWSFLSIAKVPMSWNPKDIWTVEVSASLPNCWLSILERRVLLT